MSAAVTVIAEFEHRRALRRRPDEHDRLPALYGEEIPAGTGSRDAQGVTERLVGLPLPRVVLGSVGGPSVEFDMRQYGHWCPLVICLYPGACSSPEDGRESPRLDRVQHRAFRARKDELMALGVGVIGVSSQSRRAQLDSLVANRVTHRLLSDPQLLLATELGLPTFTADGARWYQRLTLVASAGHIEKAFFPVCAARSAAQVITWIRLHDAGPGAGADAR